MRPSPAGRRQRKRQRSNRNTRHRAKYKAHPLLEIEVLEHTFERQREAALRGRNPLPVSKRRSRLEVARCLTRQLRGMAILYFAYGSNMCTGRLRARVPSARPLFSAKLLNHRLAFHKRSVDGSGKADARYTGHDDVVWGVVFELDSVEKPALDEAEGLGSGYLEKSVTVESPHGEFDAVMYYASDTDPELKPYSWYLRFVVEGARQHGLPADYVSQIVRTASINDPDAARDTRNRAIRC